MRSKQKQWPAALAISGSDSGGGAGVQADLKTFAALRVHGLVALTCITAQNPKQVTAIQACRPGLLQAQLEAVLSEFRPGAIKTGMLFDKAMIKTVAATLPWGRAPVIVDPVMVATSGARLLRASALGAILELLLPRATLVTPNLKEAEILLGKSVRTVNQARSAARALQEKFGSAFLVKGGHLRGVRTAVDFFFDGQTELLLQAPYTRGVSTHGTGCTLSAAVAGYCALGQRLPVAVASAKEYISQAIAGSVRVGRHTVLGCSLPHR